MFAHARLVLTLAPRSQSLPPPAQWLVSARQASLQQGVCLKEIAQIRLTLSETTKKRTKAAQFSVTFPTYGFVARHCNQALLLDVGFGGGVAASGVNPSVIDA